jgi:hypothetical protein
MKESLVRHKRGEYISSLFYLKLRYHFVSYESRSRLGLSFYNVLCPALIEGLSFGFAQDFSKPPCYAKILHRILAVLLWITSPNPLLAQGEGRRAIR